jgi:hypothetical protein
VARTTYAPPTTDPRPKDERLILTLGLVPIARDWRGLPLESASKPTFVWNGYRERQPMTRARRNRQLARYDKIEQSIERADTAAFKRRRDDAATWGVTDDANSRAPRAYRNSLTSRERFEIAKWKREARRREAEWRRQDAALLASMPVEQDNDDDDIVVAARELGLSLSPVTPPDPRFAYMADARFVRAGAHLRALATRQAQVGVKPRVVLPPHLRVPEDEEHRTSGYKGGRTRHQRVRITGGAF